VASGQWPVKTKVCLGLLPGPLAYEELFPKVELGVERKQSLSNRKPKTENRKPSTQKSEKGLNWLLLRGLGIVLGSLFFYAGLQKHYHAYEFAEAVLAYRLGPIWLAGVAAAVLPWVELTAGGLLIAGFKRRSSLLLLSLLIASFLVVMGVTMARGLKIDCGCGLFFQAQVGPLAILQDAVLLAWAGGLYWWELRAGAVASSQ
jgi:uncharacterized membrane protein YphA (DoxX/SURF4 family)